MNVLGVCNPNMQFIYVLSGWEGSAADSRVLRDAVHRPESLRVPTGMTLLHTCLLNCVYCLICELVIANNKFIT